MAGSSPAQRVSRYPRAHSTFSSPLSPSLVDFLSPDRHSEKTHKEALALADAVHTQIRERANRVLFMHEEKEKHDELVEKARLDAERLRLQEESLRLTDESIITEKKRIQAEEEARERERQLRELKAKKVPPLSPVAPQPAQLPVPPTQPPAPAQPAAQKPALNGNPTPRTATTSLFTAPKTNASTSNPTPAPPAPAPAPAVPAAPKPAPAAATPPADPKKQRASLIHKNLKELRKSINDVQAKQNPALKSKAGDLRREIRKCVGQLSFDRKGNLTIMSKVTAILKEGLANNVHSQLMDPSHFVFDERQPVSGAANNDQLPSLFLFLLNHLAKCVINQFMDESSANTKTADPIGVLVASTFADPALHWRGKPLIDILMAKFYVVCPVLFGARGLEKTEAGRLRVGWQKRGPSAWIPETEHYNRQTGLGAGYAAISLRDFSRSKKENPYPMSHYWAAMAQIVNTPPAEMSNTACVVLKAMIDHYEQRFLLFYGTAGIAALRLALVDFPTNAKAAGCGDVAVESLLVHGKSLKAKYGLALA